MKKITIILKPTFECNFRCQYCYHAETDYRKGRMDLSLLEEMLDKTFSYYNQVEIIFHGGEPLMMGYEFISKAIDLINKKKTPDSWLRIGLQTNGYFLDEKFCELFTKNNIQMSVSIDGIGDMNCLREKTDYIFDKLDSLREKGYTFNLLGVLHTQNIDRYSEFYEYAKSRDYHLKMNPIFKSGAAKDNPAYLLDADSYIKMLREFYPKWLDDSAPIRHVDPFYNLTAMAIQNKGHECGQCGCLTKWICVDFDGTLYPCGRSYTEDYCLGNIKDIDCLKDAFNHPNFRRLLEQSIARRMDCQNKCEFYNSCQGGCNNDCLLSGDVSKVNEFDCAVFKEMIPFIRKTIEERIKNKVAIMNPDVKELLSRRKRHG